jgi:hypothetical protein
VIGTAEELRQDRRHGDAFRIASVYSPVVRGQLKQPQTLSLVIHHGISQGGEGWVSEETNHLGKLQRWQVAEDRVEQDQMESALSKAEGECDGVGTGCIVTHEYGTFDLQLGQDSVKFGGMLR